MQFKTVPVKNVQRLSEAAEMLTTRAKGVPGIGIVDGETGFGKTTSITWLVCQVHGVLVRAKAGWGTKRAGPARLLRAILTELDIEPRGDSDRMLDDVIMALRASGRTLFIDEANHLVRNEAMIETIRDIHDSSLQPVILIGYTGLDRQLSQYRQFTRRVLQHVRFEPADFADAQLLARQLCDIPIADDLLQRMHTRSQGSVGELIVGLARAESLGRTRGLTKVTAADWGKKDDFFTGGAIPAATAGNVTPIGAVR